MKNVGVLTLSATPDLGKGGALEVPSPSTKRDKSPGVRPILRSEIRARSHEMDRAHMLVP